LVTADAASQHAGAVTYLGIENDFQDVATIQQVLIDHEPAWVRRFCEAVSSADAAVDATEPVELHQRFSLQILPVDLDRALNRLEALNAGFDAIYLDAFSPDANPECWSEAAIAEMTALLAPGGALATYCAKGSVRRAFESVGLSVTRRPGPPGKRECLVAIA